MTTATDVELIAARLIAAGVWLSTDRRIDESAAADVLGITSRTLRRWRKAGLTPTPIVIGRVTYRLAELLAFIESRRAA